MRTMSGRRLSPRSSAPAAHLQPVLPEPCAVLASMLCEKDRHEQSLFSNSERKPTSAPSGGRASTRRRKKERALSHHHAGKQLPRADDHHACGNRPGGFHRDFTPLTAGFHHVPAGDLAGVQKLLDTYPTAAVMIEIVQGEGGVIPLDRTFVKELAALLCARDVLLDLR